MISLLAAKLNNYIDKIHAMQLRAGGAKKLNLLKCYFVFAKQSTEHSTAPAEKSFLPVADSEPQ
jgi:hypothetical protein